MGPRKLIYTERWVLAYLRANPNEVNTAPSIAAALGALGVLQGTSQTVLYALRKLERTGSVARDAAGRTTVLWEAL